jgi:HD-like signal output (HDOD) protein
VLVTSFPERYSEVMAWRNANDSHVLQAEQAVMGVDHVLAGVALAEHWHFSDTMKMAIGHHHDPESPGAGLLATIVHVANAIVHALDLAREEDDLVPAVSSAAWAALGLNEESYLHVFRETELQFEEITMILMN